MYYSKFKKHEDKYRIEAKLRCKLPNFKTRKLHHKIFYKDSLLTNYLSQISELIDFVYDTNQWMLELLVCEKLIAIDYKKEIYQNIGAKFFLHYFYDITNRIYVFDQRISEFLRSNPQFKTRKIALYRNNYNYMLMQTKFRMNYVHYNQSLYFNKSLMTFESVLVLDKKSKVEIFGLSNIVEICFKALNTQEKISQELDARLNGKLKKAETYIPKLVKVPLSKFSSPKNTNIKHQTLKLAK